jgi:hypothetical protein
VWIRARSWPSDHYSYGTPPLPIHPRSSQIGVRLRNPASTGAASGASSACSNQCDQYKSSAMEVSYFSVLPIANQLRIRTSPRLRLDRCVLCRPGLCFVRCPTPRLPIPDCPFRPISQSSRSLDSCQFPCSHIRASQNAKFWLTGTRVSVAGFCTLRALFSVFKTNSPENQDSKLLIV